MPSDEPVEPVDIDGDESGVIEPVDDSVGLADDVPQELSDPTDDEID